MNDRTAIDLPGNLGLSGEASGEDLVERVIELALSYPDEDKPELAAVTRQLDELDTSDLSVVVFGGGTGLSNLIGGDSRHPDWPESPFKGLKRIFPKTRAVVCTTDDGGSTGELLKDLDSTTHARLVRAFDLRGSYGNLTLVAGDARTAHELRLRNLDPLPIGATTPGERLFVLAGSFEGPSRTPARLLYEDAQRCVVAVPDQPETIRALARTRAGRLHGGMSPVPRRRQRPPSTITVGPALILRNLICAGLAGALVFAGNGPLSLMGLALGVFLALFMVFVYLCTDQIIANAQAMAGDV